MTTHLEMMVACKNYDLIKEQNEYVCDELELDRIFNENKWDGEPGELFEKCVSLIIY